MEKIIQRGKVVTNNQMSNMANIHHSLLEAKKCEDLIYFVEDDYLHKRESLREMVFTYERVASQTNNEIILCPTDYPYLYTKSEITQNFLGQNYHWRKINETLCTFLTSKKLLKNIGKSMLACARKSTHPLKNLYTRFMSLSYVYPQFHL